ncbi:putative alpha/beta hydrolase [Eremomyces bilateralis CBS 781.70]|uniref:Alpha/beta hydrolase n=1 Tax=Eremomyces bilateralis CBS 781.70 TaxID=1392243 RepID=A0A6G1GGM8_9PEZI|nr:putative alpha/beta hydrolase [Eremomyces bilateralis CBS 781.70]KAF1817086.1 putative alpha/beta hydrolase [Eremomyces bilateralis CBS 781.70]
MSSKPGLLYVTMQPSPSLPIERFHDWYNNEHGPLRLRLPFFRNGLRYRASDLSSDQLASAKRPEWLAIYDVTDTEELGKPVYTRLRDADVKTSREKETMKQIKVDREILDLAGEWKSESFEEVETLRGDVETEGNVLMVVSVKLQLSKAAEEQVLNWFPSEHIPLVSKSPGWRRTRHFVTSSLDDQHVRTFLTLHEWAPSNSIGGSEFRQASTIEWVQRLNKETAADISIRTYNLHLIFGSAPRHLGDIAEWSYSNDMTRTFPPTDPTSPFGSAIESYITTPDGAALPFRLEGSPSPSAPLIVCINSILTTYPIWDSFVSSFFAHPPNRRYRILRYNPRGRSQHTGTAPVSIDLLAADAITLLDALRVPKAACVIGVSLGGITALNTALKHAGRVEAFVSCDTNARAPPSNAAAWDERIAVAEKEGLTADGKAVVGERLAEMTVRRWFVGESYDGGAMEREAERVKEMVRTNSLEGFRRGVRALYAYDVGGEMAEGKVRGLFVVGKGDGVLPDTMKKMADAYRWRGADGKEGGVELKVVDGAGHLPMVEQGGAVAKLVQEFLAEVPV